SLNLEIDAASGVEQEKFTWAVTPEASSDDHAFLTEVIEIAKVDDGASLPTVGSAGLAEVARLIGTQMDQLTKMAERAAASGDKQSAGRIAEAVLRGDPGNLQARTVQNVIAGKAVPAESAPAAAA